MAILNLNGDILNEEWSSVYDFLNIPNVSVTKVDDVLDNLTAGEDLTVNIASNGGFVDVARLIYTNIAKAAQSHKTTCNITGMAASAATIIAMACPVINISPSGAMLIHKASGDFSNMNADDLQQYINQLNDTDQFIVSLYEQRTGLDEATLLKMMSDETQMNAKTCIQKGFADSLMDITPNKVAITNSLDTMMNPKTLERMKDIMNKIQQNEQPEKLDRVQSLKQAFGLF